MAYERNCMSITIFSCFQTQLRNSQQGSATDALINFFLYLAFKLFIFCQCFQGKVFVGFLSVFLVCFLHSPYLLWESQRGREDLLTTCPLNNEGPVWVTYTCYGLGVQSWRDKGRSVFLSSSFSDRAM